MRRPQSTTTAREDDHCPCGSGATYGACCGPLLEGAAAPTAEALMRSRYTAYAVGDADHVFRTWHPRTRPESPDHLKRGGGLRWDGLEVLDTAAGGAADETGEVEFRARGAGASGPFELHERSRFARRAGRWVYVDGDLPGDG